MNIVAKSRRTVSVLRKEGFLRVADILISKYLPFSLPAELKWRAGVRSELEFWDDYIRVKGLGWSDNYPDRLDPNLPLQPRLEALLPPEKEVHILDVGAGPLTWLGKISRGRALKITAIDPLADEYDKILHKYGVQPIARTRSLAGEDLTRRFTVNTFDLCCARNSIDHAYNPERVILRMIDVVKKGRYVLLEHNVNEAEKAKYTGLHQWNFDLSGDKDFLIRSKSHVTNMTQKYADRCAISCELGSEAGRDWLITRILKN